MGTPEVFAFFEGMEVKAEMTDRCNIKFTDTASGKYFFFNVTDAEFAQFANKIAALQRKIGKNQGHWVFVRDGGSNG